MPEGALVIRRERSAVAAGRLAMQPWAAGWLGGAGTAAGTAAGQQASGPAAGRAASEARVRRACVHWGGWVDGRMGG